MAEIAPPHVDALAERFAERCETHVSWVFLGEHEVLKLKKPVAFAFLDFRTLEARRRACEAEVTLNRRLAADVYLGTVAVVRTAHGRFELGGEGEVVDFAVRMRRLPDDERAEAWLARGALDASHVERLATVLVDFHARAEVDRDPSGPGSPTTVLAHARENLEALEARARAHLGEARARALASAHEDALARITPRLEERLAAGHVRDGHGDLRLDHVYFGADGSIRVLDCVEFSRDFRVADVTADVAFFAMNLEEAGRPDLAERFVARYARDAGDHALYALLDFFVAYFALVRAKVRQARASQLEGAVASAERARVDRLLDLALRVSTRKGRPTLFVVAGVIASGKSTFAARLGERLGAPVLESDRIRKQRAGIAPDRPLEGAEAYAREATLALYADVRERAAIVLASGRSVVVDASFRSHAHRAAFRALADSLGVSFRLVLCTAPREVLEGRLRAREREGGVSDARLELLDAFLASFEPLDGDERASAVVVETSDADATRARLAELAPGS